MTARNGRDTARVGELPTPGVVGRSRARRPLILASIALVVLATVGAVRYYRGGIPRAVRPTLPTSPPGRLARTATAGPLRRHATNPRYFADRTGRPVLLTGAHTWSNLNDNGFGDPPPAFDYDAYLDFLVANNHDFIRLWMWENAPSTTSTTCSTRSATRVTRRRGIGSIT